tara:strand:- start:2458 stop:2670 length:213 start_codon:yes stop_codon:yes gene_type:complete
MKNISLDQLTDLEIDGVCMADYPDFCDAYVDSAVWKNTGLDLSPDELETLNDMDECRSYVNENAYQTLID